MRVHYWMRIVPFSLLMAGSAGMPLPSAIAASAAPSAFQCSPSAIRPTAVTDDASQAWGPFTLFLGTVRFTNRGATCVWPVGRVTTRTAVGYPGHHSPVGASSSGFLSRPVTLPRGTSASVQVRVDGTRPRGWNSGLPCGPRQSAVGLLVTSPPWLHATFVAFAHARDYCGLRVFTSTGTLQRD